MVAEAGRIGLRIGLRAWRLFVHLWRSYPALRAPAAGLAAGFLVTACATLGGGPDHYAVGYTETGKASWYGPGFHGRLAANGEVFDQEALTAAHRTLPFGTLVEVTRRDTGHQVVVRITDRGPFVRGRILDLSHGAARRLAAIGPGVVPVRLKVVGMPGDAAPGSMAGADAFTVQLGRFSDPDRARLLVERLGARIPGLRLIPEAGNGSVRVVSRPYTTYRRAAKAAWFIRRDLQPDAFVVREDRVLTQ
jgi:rare lipoprotein A